VKPKFLGKKNATFKSPSESILDAIYRELPKEMFGEDIWNAYDSLVEKKSNQPLLLPLELEYQQAQKELLSQNHLSFI